MQLLSKTDPDWLCNESQQGEYVKPFAVGSDELVFHLLPIKWYNLETIELSVIIG